MNNTLLLVCTFISSLAFAGPRPMLSPKGELARARATGGELIDRREMTGAVKVINAQKRLEECAISNATLRINKDLCIEIGIEGGSFDVFNPATNGTASVFIVDDPRLPMSLVALEAKWAAINISHIYIDDDRFFHARFNKELYRVVGNLLGASATKFNNCIFQAISSASDLDQIPEIKVPLEYSERFAKYMPAIGITPYKLVTYRKACMQGWAPLPTNEFQKAIWQQVHEPPCNPLKITFDPKTDTK